jgi:hypothetical protein
MHSSPACFTLEAAKRISVELAIDPLKQNRILKSSPCLTENILSLHHKDIGLKLFRE